MAVYRITCTWKNTFELSFAQNVIHMEDPANTLTPSQVGDLIDVEWWGGSTSTMLRIMTANMSQLDFLNIQRVDTTPAGGVLPYSTLKTKGTLVDNVFHEVVGYVFRLFDGGAGPRHRGRLYHFGTPSSSNTRLGPSAGNVTAFNTLRAAWLSKFGPSGSTGLRWVLWHRDLTGSARWSQINDIRLASAFGIQRRRNPGVGL